MLDCHPKLVAIDEEAEHQSRHGRRFGKANRAAHKTLDPCPQIQVFALDFLRRLFADFVLLGVDMPLVGTPPSVSNPIVSGTNLAWQLLTVSGRNFQAFGRGGTGQYGLSTQVKTRKFALGDPKNTPKTGEPSS